MIKTIFFAVAILVLCAKIHESEGNISLGSCSLSCNENEDHAHDLIGARGGLQGPPGKRGPVGQKGERGVKGDIGGKGDIGVKGDPGFRGESGIKGELGMKGDAGVQGQSGPRGIPGSSCDCSRYDELVTKMAAMQQELDGMKGRAAGPGEDWSRASNNRWYKLFKHERVSHETAKSRCAEFGAKLACVGLRTPELRSEIKSFLPNPIPVTWIGLDDLVSQGNYVWADGVASTRTNTDWYPGQPYSNSERCAVTGGSCNYQVCDTICTENYNYLCEF